MSLLTGLVSYWKMQEDSATREDSHGSNTLTRLGGNPDTEPGVVGLAALFSVGDSIRAVAPVAGLGAGDLSWHGWIRPDAYSNTWLTLYNVTAARIVVRVGFTGFPQTPGWPKVEIYTDSDQAILNSSVWGVLPTDQYSAWYVEYDATDKRVRVGIDGAAELAQSALVPAGSVQSLANCHLSLGHDSSSSTYSGAIDELGMWARKLTAAERVELYNSGVGEPYPFGKSRRKPRPGGSRIGTRKADR